MRPLLLLALLATGTSAFGLLAWPGRWNVSITPTTGKYTGVLTVRRTVLPGGPETTFTAKVEARVESDGRMTILTAVPESPGAAANIEKSVVRAVPINPLGVVTGPVVTQAPADNLTLSAKAVPTPASASVARAAVARATPTPPVPPAPPTVVHLTVTPVAGPPLFIQSPAFSVSNYLVNGTFPATLSLNSGIAYLTYSVPQFGPASSDPLPTGTQPAQEPVARVSYDFALRFQRPLPAAAPVTSPR